MFTHVIALFGNQRGHSIGGNPVSQKPNLPAARPSIHLTCMYGHRPCLIGVVLSVLIILSMIMRETPPRTAQAHQPPRGPRVEWGVLL